MVQHVVQGGDLTILVGDLEKSNESPFLDVSSGFPTHDGVFDTRWAGNLFAVRFDVLDPSLVLVEAIGRETDELHTTSRKVVGAAGDLAELGGANRGKIIYKRTPISSSGFPMMEGPTGVGEENRLCNENGRVSVIYAICTRLSTNP